LFLFLFLFVFLLLFLFIMTSAMTSASDLTPFTLYPEPHVLPTYARYPLALSHGEGAYVWDITGRRFLDALSGIAVNTLGHKHPRYVAALTEQLNTIIHTSNLYGSPLQEKLAAKLCALSDMEKVFFCNSGLEANEAAIKIARKYGNDKRAAAGDTNPDTVSEIIVFDKAFHGRSLATLSATGNEKVQKGFAPLVAGFVRVPMNDLAAIQAKAASNPNICAVFIEAVQGEGGIVGAKNDYLKQLRALCDAQGWLLMIDEVQCGIGRTGKWFAHQWAGILPDVMPLAKGLGGGVPIGAVVTRGKASSVFSAGNHGTTFGGNPLAMRAALEVIAVMEDDHLIANASAMGLRIKTGLENALAGHIGAGLGVQEIRAHGLMMGVVLAQPCSELVAAGMAKGLLFNVTADRVIRLLPPLILTAAQADEIVATIAALVLEFLAKHATPTAQGAA
jgi:acetylornithine/N-succinyldiaminopimelate aminotransferase